MTTQESSMPHDYYVRRESYGLISKEDLEKLIEEHRHRAVVVDVRSEQEIADSGSFRPTKSWKTVPCTATDATPLIQKASELFPEGKDTPIILYCKSGRRANTAIEALKEQGYQYVWNAGGYDDIVAMGLK